MSQYSDEDMEMGHADGLAAMVEAADAGEAWAVNASEPCADCGRPVRLINDWPVNGIVIRGNPSEVICEGCAERLEAQAQQADVAAREADRVAREERHWHDD